VRGMVPGPPPAPDLLLAARFAFLASLCALIPVPFLDTFTENRVRRALVRRVAADQGVTLSPEEVSTLADLPSGGCRGMVTSLLWWPVKKLLRTIATLFLVKGLVDSASEVVHRSLMVHHAVAEGLLPGASGRVRRAMDRALDHVDTRLVERAFFGALRNPRGEFNRMVWEAARGLGHGQERAAAGTVGPHTRELSEAMAQAVDRTGLVPEVMHWFHAELQRVDPVDDDAEPGGAPPFRARAPEE